MKILKEMGVAAPSNKELPSDYTVLSVDPSTNSLAFSVFASESTEVNLVAYGKINFPRKSVTSERCRMINAVLPELVQRYEIDTLVIEETIYIQNPTTTRLLAYVVGALWCKGVDLDLEVRDVGPLKWKAYIGYKRVTAKEIAEWEQSIGAREAKKKASFERKDRVRSIMFHKFPKVEEEDYDIWDAIGIGWWGIHECY